MKGPAARRGALACAALAWAALLLACAPCAPSQDGVIEVESAGFHPSPRDEPPEHDDPEWRPVTLPDFWGMRRRAGALDGWYRVAFDAPGDRQWAALVPGDWERLRISLNGEPQIEALPQRADLRPAGASLLVMLPADELRPGRNELLLRFHAVPWRIGSLGAVAVGPAVLVQGERDRRYLRSSVLPGFFSWFALACAVLHALLARWDETRGAPWFAAGTAGWCLPLIEPLRPLLDVDRELPASILLHAFPVCFAIGFHRVLQLGRPRLERALLGTIGLGATLRALAPSLLVPAVDWLWWIANLAIAAYLVQLAVRARAARALPRAGPLLAAGALTIAAGLHDVASLFAGRPLLGAALGPYVPPVIALATAAALVARLGERLGEARRLNVELERRVEEKRRELAGSYARMAELERDRAIAAERERLMREMHDGTGGQLVSALAMVEGGAFERSAVVEVLHDALADLRFSIDSLDPSEPDLLSLLGAARARLEPRLEARGLRFSWEVRDVPPPARFGPETALQVLRIFQEAVVNALRHAGARVIAVRTRAERDAQGTWAVVEVADDGRGFAAEAAGAAGRAGGGRGLGNMRRRAASIGAELAVRSGPGGTCVRLRLPLGPEVGGAPADQPSTSTSPVASAS